MLFLVYNKNMTEVEVTREDLRALATSRLISNFQYSILTKFYFNRQQLDDIAKEWKFSNRVIIDNFQKGLAKLTEFHRLRLRNERELNNYKQNNDKKTRQP